MILSAHQCKESYHKQQPLSLEVLIWRIGFQSEDFLGRRSSVWFLVALFAMANSNTHESCSTTLFCEMKNKDISLTTPSSKNPWSSLDLWRQQWNGFSMHPYILTNPVSLSREQDGAPLYIPALSWQKSFPGLSQGPAAVGSWPSSQAPSYGINSVFQFFKHPDETGWDHAGAVSHPPTWADESQGRYPQTSAIKHLDWARAPFMWKGFLL